MAGRKGASGYPVLHAAQAGPAELAQWPVAFLPADPQPAVWLRLAAQYVLCTVSLLQHSLAIKVLFISG